MCGVLSRTFAMRDTPQCASALRRTPPSRLGRRVFVPAQSHLGGWAFTTITARAALYVFRFPLLLGLPPTLPGRAPRTVGTRPRRT